MQCTKCGTTDAPNWVTHKVSNIVESKSSTLHTVNYCPTCYEEEATNAI